MQAFRLRMSKPTPRSSHSFPSPTAEPSTDPSVLLLASGLSESEVARILAPYGFRQPAKADANLQSIAGEPRTRKLLAIFIADLLDEVSQTADPDQALMHWEEYVRVAMNRTQLLEYVGRVPRMRHLLCTVFGNSPSFSATLIRDPSLIYWLAEEPVLTQPPNRREWEQHIRTAVSNFSVSELKLDAVRRIRRREMLRLGVRDLLRLSTVEETIADLSDLAGVLVQVIYEVVLEELHSTYGRPMHRDRQGCLVETGFVVMAMGKLGGRELNFSSDIDLIYVYAEEEGSTVLPRSRKNREATAIQNEEFFEYLSRELTKALSDVTQEGYVFRVDLRLRAEGAVGQLARSIRGYRQYYQDRGQDWERLSLLKAWPLAGDHAVGRAFLRMVQPFVFGKKSQTVDLAEGVRLVNQVKAVKDMIDIKMAARGHGQRNVKLGVGGIREIEFIVQVIQALCGGRLARLRDRATLSGLEKFRRLGLVTDMQTRQLREAYVFLRDVEHKLQMVHDLQTHALPDTEEEMHRCAVRMGYHGDGRLTALEQFTADLVCHTKNVNQAFRALFDAPERSPVLHAALAVVKTAAR